MAQSICDQLAQREMPDLTDDLIAHLAAAATEMTEQLATAWRVSGNETPIVLVRMIARANAIDPSVGGPRSAALLDRLLP